MSLFRYCTCALHQIRRARYMLHTMNWLLQRFSNSANTNGCLMRGHSADTRDCRLMQGGGVAEHIVRIRCKWDLHYPRDPVHAPVILTTCNLMCFVWRRCRRHAAVTLWSTIATVLTTAVTAVNMLFISSVPIRVMLSVESSSVISYDGRGFHLLCWLWLTTHAGNKGYDIINNLLK